MENIYHTIRGRTKSPRTLESISKDPLSAAKPYHCVCPFKKQYRLALTRNIGLPQRPGQQLSNRKAVGPDSLSKIVPPIPGILAPCQLQYIYIFISQHYWCIPGFWPSCGCCPTGFCRSTPAAWSRTRPKTSSPFLGGLDPLWAGKKPITLI